MRTFFSLMGAVLISSILVFAQAPPANPVSAFEQRLIDQQKQFLQASQSKDSSAVERAVADDFQGIQENGDLYDKSDVVESGMPKDMRAYDFHVVKLTNDSAVVSYNLIFPGDHPRYRHMADAWARIDGRWKLKFRQITPNLWSANDTD
jgi:hypothetical protein